MIPLLPHYVKNVIDFGCAAGRNLAAFKSTHHLFGVDIADESSLEFQVSGITYIKSKLQDIAFPGSLETFLCISHGTLMYLNPTEQRIFIKRLIQLGCRNFIFQEYDKETLGRDGYFEPYDFVTQFFQKPRRRGYAFRNPFYFEKRWFRPEIPTWLRLETEANH